jgi:Tol biopolymer transport system component
MFIRSIFRSTWMRYTFVAVGVLVLTGAGYVARRLDTTQPAMNNTVGVVEGGQCTGDEEKVETIVYTSLRPGNLDVYLFDGLGGTPRRLTDHGNLDYNPTLSPDGQWVVFASDRAGATSLYALDLTAGGEPNALTTHAAMDDAPAISPDGSLVAFVSTRDGNPDIFVMPFAPGDPGAEARAVNLSRSPYGDFNPVFSPDGALIAFSSNRAEFQRSDPTGLIADIETATAIYTMGIDGSDVRRVVSVLGLVGSPGWTADGASILYYQATHASSSAVYRQSLHGGGTVRLSPEGMIALTPTAGPDGTIIFAGIDASATAAGPAALQPAGGRLYRVAADGSDLTAISGPGQTYLAPRYDAASARLVAYSDGPVDEAVRMANGTPFTWPGALRTVRLSDRCVHLHAIRSYFPSMPRDGQRVFSVPWVHEANGVPPGPAPIIEAALDGTGLIERYPRQADGFVWSPVVTQDGEWIFFGKGPRFGAVDVDVGIWKVRVGETDAIHLTADSEANDAFPDVSADGQRLVFRSGRDARAGSGFRGPKEIYIMDATGKQVRRISHAGATSTMPAISPDGQWVVYSTTLAGAGYKLWIQSLVDSNDEGRLLEPARESRSGRDMHPRFSPDGRWIVFTSSRAGLMDEMILSGMFPQPYGELYAVPADGSGPAVRLTHDKWEDGLPFWGNSPGAATRQEGSGVSNLEPGKR